MNGGSRFSRGFVRVCLSKGNIIINLMTLNKPFFYYDKCCVDLTMKRQFNGNAHHVMPENYTQTDRKGP
jgi:hypothetical protein